MPTVKKKDKDALVEAGKGTRFSSTNQPTRETRSLGQQKRQDLQRGSTKILAKKPNKKVFVELKEINPGITKRMSNVEVAYEMCVLKAQRTGNTRDLIALLKISGHYVEEKASTPVDPDEEDTITGVEYIEL